MPRTALLFIALCLAAVFASPARAARIGDAAPDIDGERWLNSDSLMIAKLRGKVVLVEFWTYG